MNGPIRRVALAIFVSFGMLLSTVTYIQAVAGPKYRDDTRNSRVQLSRAGKERGIILAADGSVLAESVSHPEDPRRFVRVYPEGSEYAHSVGFTSLLFGDSGLEDSYSDELRSKRDLTVSDLVTAMFGGDLRPQNVETTLLPALQNAALSALGDQTGAVVAVDPRSGAVMTMASSPAFNPNLLTGGDAAPTWESLSADPNRPLLDRAGRQSYPPGSTFKVIVTAAAIESGLAGPGTEFANPTELQLPGSTSVIRNAGGDRCGSGDRVTLEEAFRRSCNTTFGQLGMQLGTEDLQSQAESFGFNRSIPFEWEVLRSVFPGDLIGDDLAALAQSSIGERDVQASPLLMAMVSAAIANGGVQMEPFLVRRIYDATGAVVFDREPRLWQTAVSPATASVLTGMMEQVVASGTGTNAAVSGVRIAGKTGTAEGGGGPPHVWFIGFAPVEQPTIAIAVVVESGGDAGENASGGSVAAPIARAVLERWLRPEG